MGSRSGFSTTCEGAQEKPRSILQSAEQPSPETVLPSSHSWPLVLSMGKSSPSPQTVVQGPPAGGQVGSRRHRGEQPSPASLLPSSHGSEPSRTPLPHTVRWQGWLGCGQIQPELSPVSIAQVGLQPSPAVVLPSSHCSGASRTPSPHFGRQAPPRGQVHPDSTWQLALQPSPGVTLPSSHDSPPFCRWSPQTTLRTQGLPGIGQT